MRKKFGLNLDLMIHFNINKNHIESMNLYEIHVTNGNSMNNVLKEHPFISPFSMSNHKVNELN